MKLNKQVVQNIGDPTAVGFQLPGPDTVVPMYCFVLGPELLY